MYAFGCEGNSTGSADQVIRDHSELRKNHMATNAPNLRPGELETDGTPQRFGALITGGSGLIGSSLSDALLERGASVRRLVRRQPSATGEYIWDPYASMIDDRAFEGVDVVINLSGAGVGDKRWTSERKAALYESRITTTRVLAERLAWMEKPPRLFISQSAIGIYGDRGDEILTEESSNGPEDDFLAALTVDWEKAAARAVEAGIRVVHPRTGLVLSRDAQLLQRLVPLFKSGLGGPIGDGSQWWSWVTLTDVIRATEHLIQSDIEGPVNLVAPSPVRQKEFATLLARAVRRPAILPVPKMAMRLALGGQKAEAIGFSSTRALPERLSDDGFEFADSDLQTALATMLA